MEKITYASLGSLGRLFHDSFDGAMNRVIEQTGKTHGIYVDRQWIRRRNVFEDVNPSNSEHCLGRFTAADSKDADRAISAAQAAFSGWAETSWQARVELCRKAAEIMTARQFDLAAILTLEVGKNRFEAIAEVSEAVDLILYYADQFERNQGYEIPLVTGAKECTRSVLKPYGVWAVIAPFNFPLALATGMAFGALLGGNSVVFKPASDTPWSGICLAEIIHEAGFPPGVFNCLTGSGSAIGDSLLSQANAVVFTGSKEVGSTILEKFKGLGRPAIAEMGGKNPAIVMPSADLEDAAEGVVRSAFGMGGQKCSACSRLYAHEKIYSELMQLIVDKTSKLVIGDPRDEQTFVGPLINESAVKKYQRAVRLGRAEGRLVYGAGPLKAKEFKRGYFVAPAIFDKLPRGSKMFREEFFAPVLSVARVKALDEAIQLSNNSEYGLTAGIFTNDPAEQDQFFAEIQSGVTYCNRRGGATTGAWPGVQSFGGWKASGSSGKSALGPHYVAQFMREQSQTVVKK